MILFPHHVPIQPYLPMSPRVNLSFMGLTPSHPPLSMAAKIFFPYEVPSYIFFPLLTQVRIFLAPRISFTSQSREYGQRLEKLFYSFDNSTTRWKPDPFRTTNSEPIIIVSPCEVVSPCEESSIGAQKSSKAEQKIRDPLLSSFYSLYLSL